MNWLASLDVTLFFTINHGLQNPLFDVIMPFATHLENWLIPMALLVLWMAVKGGKRERILLLLLIPTIALSDQLSASIMKPLIGRLRPCHTLEDVHLLVKCGKGKAFPSSHAANMAAVAMIFTYHYRRYWRGFVAFAGLIGFTRIYVGVHYPFDVLGGFVVGAGCGAFVLVAYYQWLAAYVERWLAKRNNTERQS